MNTELIVLGSFRESARVAWRADRLSAAVTGSARNMSIYGDSGSESGMVRAFCSAPRFERLCRA
jgi:hypothetical protein